MHGRPSCLGTEPVCCWPDSHLSFLCLGTRLGLFGGLSDPSWNWRAAGPRAISLAFVISSLAGSAWWSCLSYHIWDRVGVVLTCQPSLSPLPSLDLSK